MSKGSFGWGGILSGLGGVAVEAYNKDQDRRLYERRLESDERIRAQQADAQAVADNQSRGLLQMVLIGAGGLLALMVTQKALK